MTALRQRMLEDMKIRNLALNTQASYLLQVSQFARHFGKSPEVLGREEIRAYQLYLTEEKKLAPGSITIAVSALRFLYKVTLRREWNLEDIIPAPKAPQKLPIILSPEEVLEFLGCVRLNNQEAYRTVRGDRDDVPVCDRVEAGQCFPSKVPLAFFDLSPVDGAVQVYPNARRQLKDRSALERAPRCRRGRLTKLHPFDRPGFGGLAAPGCQPAPLSKGMRRWSERVVAGEWRGFFDIEAYGPVLRPERT
jgi:hypothetical protein